MISKFLACAVNEVDMVICIVSDDYEQGATGVGLHVQCIVRELNHRGHKIIVITSKKKGDLSYEEKDGVHIYRMPSFHFLGTDLALATMSSVKKILLSYKVQIVHCHYFGLLMQNAIKAAKALSLKCIFTQHILPYGIVGHLSATKMLSVCAKMLKKLIEHTMFKECNKCDLILVPSSGMLSLLKQYGVTVSLRLMLLPVNIPGASW